LNYLVRRVRDRMRGCVLTYRAQMMAQRLQIEHILPLLNFS